MCAPKPLMFQRQRQRGASLVELMVGLVIALLVGLTATGAAIFFTASQRQGVGTGGAIISATTTLSAMKESAAQAGLGFFGDSSYLCNSINLSVGTRNLSQAVFSPVQVTRAGDVDQLDFVYASRVAGGADVPVLAPTTTTNALLRSYLPAAVGQAVVFTPPTPGLGCTVRTVTAITPFAALPAPGTPLTLTFANTGNHNQVVFAAPVNYPVESKLTMLGALEWHRYRLDGRNLVLDRPLPNDSSAVVNNVIALRAQYGIAAVGETTISQWVEPTGAWASLNAANMMRVRAIRVGLITRSPQPEKPEAVSGQCTASAAAPQVLDFTATFATVSGEPAWNCYRYRSVTVILPLRNLVMGTQT